MSMMNQNQQRYAMTRVKEIQAARDAALQIKHTKKAKSATNADKIRAIRNGDYYLRKHGWDLSTPIGQAVLFYDLDKPDELDHDAYRKDREKLRKEASKVSDEIMLGDAEKAKTLLTKFEDTVK